MSLTKFWKNSPVVVEEEIAPKISRVLLECANGSVNVSALDEHGFIFKTVSLGDFGSNLTQFKAEELASERGWSSNGDWFTTEGSDFMDLEPTLITVAFVSGVLEEDEAIRYAHKAGLNVSKVISQNYVETDGKNYVAFSVETPKGWSW